MFDSLWYSLRDRLEDLRGLFRWSFWLKAFRRGPRSRPKNQFRPTVLELEKRELLTIGTTSAVASSVNPTYHGQSTTLTGTVTQDSGSTVPSGSLEFIEGASTVLATESLNGSGVATYSISTLAIGTDYLHVTYLGNINFTGSSSSPLSQVVAADTTTSLSSSVNPSIGHQVVTFTSDVAAVSPGTGTPSGDVSFYDSSTLLGTSLLSSGVATYSTASAALSVGSHTITAVYDGDTGVYATSTSAAVTQVVDAPTVTVTTASAFDTVAGIASGVRPIGTFTDNDPSLNVTDYSATINWGDGSTDSTCSSAAGTITSFDDILTVLGNHVFSTAGTYTVTLTVNDMCRAKFWSHLLPN